MPDPHVISALADKAHDLRQAIVSYEERLDRTRRELAVVSATLAILDEDRLVGQPERVEGWTRARKAPRSAKPEGPRQLDSM